MDLLVFYTVDGVIRCRITIDALRVRDVWDVKKSAVELGPTYMKAGHTELYVGDIAGKEHGNCLDAESLLDPNISIYVLKPRLGLKHCKKCGDPSHKSVICPLQS